MVSFSALWGGAHVGFLVTGMTSDLRSEGCKWASSGSRCSCLSDDIHCIVPEKLMHTVILLYHLLCHNAEFGGSKLLAVFLVTRWRLCGSQRSKEIPLPEKTFEDILELLMCITPAILKPISGTWNGACGESIL